MPKGQPRSGTPRVRSANPKKAGSRKAVTGKAKLDGGRHGTSDHYPQRKSGSRGKNSGSVPGPVTSTESTYNTGKTRGARNIQDVTVNPDGTRRVRSINSKY